MLLVPILFCVVFDALWLFVRSIVVLVLVRCFVDVYVVCAIVSISACT